MQLDPEQVKSWFWRVLDDNGDLLPMELSLDNGETWTEMSVGENEDGDDANQWTFAGFNVDGDEATARANTQVTQGRTHGIVRFVDDPEIETARFVIDCY